MIHTVKVFSIVNETEREVFLEFPCFLYDPSNLGNFISDSSAFSKMILVIWKVLGLHNAELNWLEKAMALHSSTLAWKIPWAEEPGRLQSMGSLRVRHDWATSLSLFTFMHWRRKWQPTPLFLPGESQGRGSLVGCGLWVAQSRTQLKWLSSRTELNWSPASKILSMALPECTHQCNCPMLWTFFSPTLLGNLDEDWRFPVLWWERNDTWFLIDIVYLLLPTLSIHHCIEQETNKQKTVDFYCYSLFCCCSITELCLFVIPWSKCLCAPKFMCWIIEFSLSLSLPCEGTVRCAGEKHSSPAN